MYEELIKRLKALARLEVKNGESVIHVSSEAVAEIRDMAQKAADVIEFLQKAVNLHKYNSEFWEDQYNSLADEKWIPVTERLPNENVAVLTWGEEQAVVLIDWLHNGEWAVRDGVTHWRPLPQPPTDCKQLVTDSNQVQEEEK